MIINFFDSLQAVKHFAGEDYMIPIFGPEARALLKDVETIAHHNEARASTVYGVPA